MSKGSGIRDGMAPARSSADPVFHRLKFTRCRPRSREHRTRSRFAFVFHVVQVAVRGIVRGPGAPDPAKVKRGRLLDSIASTA